MNKTFSISHTGKLVFVIIIILFSSCKKEKSLHQETISGIALHTITKQPLTNQQIYIWTSSHEGESSDGEPIFNSNQYYTTTDNNGKFEIRAQVGPDWLFAVSLVTGEYIQKSPLKNTVVLDIELARMLYDTILAEKPGFVSYDLKNINDTYPNDSLFINAYSYKSFGQATGHLVDLTSYSGYNWIFPGQNIDMQIRDTVPAESIVQIPVTWFHKRIDTIIKKSEFINISVGGVSNYQIHY